MVTQTPNLNKKKNIKWIVRERMRKRIQNCWPSEDKYHTQLKEIQDAQLLYLTVPKALPEFIDKKQGKWINLRDLSKLQVVQKKQVPEQSVIKKLALKALFLCSFIDTQLQEGKAETSIDTVIEQCEKFETDLDTLSTETAKAFEVGFLYCGHEEKKLLKGHFD